ncbi:hypothetical protein AVEN_27787-1 [Araneus ventricosus]|uniref:Uncharacterized protein n=1 Tax=Araneus ventricosus TaxID=182803 RepID=A0A4Y2VX45_ARAVE|nr:hypothetical protein AVEN_9329-1 [Araneus ventricosus]GBO28938.1 hypothetical protein AVEN_27787-1 [Araneus ventricosus]
MVSVDPIKSWGPDIPKMAVSALVSYAVFKMRQKSFVLKLGLILDSSKQSCLLYGRPIFGEARPTSRLRYGQIASRASIQFLHTKSPIAQQTQEILLKPTNLDGLGLTSDTAVMKRRAN